MKSNNINHEPEIFGLFPCAAEMIRLKKENKDGMYNERVSWLIYILTDAISATTHESNRQLRGALITKHLLTNCPVVIDPLEDFATYGLLSTYDAEKLNNNNVPKDLPTRGATSNHIALNYSTLLKKGICGLLLEINEKKDLCDFEHDVNNIDTKKKLIFYNSLEISLGGVLDYANRFKQEALRLHDLEKCYERKIKLKRLADVLNNVPLKPATSFFEALQSLLIYHFAMRIVTQEVNSIGRLDYILHDYYIHDLNNGIITQREAAEWLQIPRIKSAIMTGQSDSIILGGSNPDGTPFWNDLTYFILDATKELNLQGPQIWFRYAPGQPRSLLHRAFQSIREGKAQPGFFNDNVTVKALMRAGIKEEHAYDYVSCQCVEISPSGRSNILSGYLYYNVTKPLEILLNKGKEFVYAKDDSGRSESFWQESEYINNVSFKYDTFEEFQNAYEDCLRFYLQKIIRETNEELKSKPTIEFTISSALLDGCINNGLSALDGGTIYNQTFPNFTGTVTAADSLAAIRKYVFEEKKASLDEVAQICRSNFSEHEEIRQYLLNRCPKYGNEDSYVDDIASWIFNIVDDELLKHVNPYGAKYAAEYFGWKMIDEQAYTLSATPDGRHWGESPSGTLGGDLGRERNGITALFNSITTLNHTAAPGGMNVNLRISRSLLEKDSDVEKMIDLLLVYFNKGGAQIQINCISREKLLDAQLNPEKYRDLCVRVSGQSLYFVELGTALQNQIINRVEHF